MNREIRKELTKYRKFIKKLRAIGLEMSQYSDLSDAEDHVCEAFRIIELNEELILENHE